MRVEEIKGAKTLRYRVVDENGTVWARVLSRPLAERVAVLAYEANVRARIAVDGLIEEDK